MTTKTDPGSTKANGKSGKKPKSAGFIESSQYKPTWLETGPLSPDMLPPPPSGEPEPAPPPSDDIAERLAALDRLYADLAPDALPVASENRILVVQEPDAVEDVEAADDEGQTAPPAQALLADLEDGQASPVDESAWMTATVAPAPVTEDVSPTEDSEATPPAAEVEPLNPEPSADAIVLPAKVEAMLADIDLPESSVPAAVPVDSRPGPADADAATAAAVVAAAPAATSPEPVAVPAPKIEDLNHGRRPIFDSTGRRLLVGSLLFFGLALLTVLINPFQRLALGTASLARPSQPTGLPAPAGQETAWCASGDFIDEGAALPQLDDAGQAGDLVAGDDVYSLDIAIATPGAYQWQVVSCSDPTLAYPGAPAWVRTSAAGQVVTLQFYARERQDPLFFPIPYVVSAQDGTTDFRLVGDFQGWDLTDASGQLEPVSAGAYQQVRRIAQPGTHEAFIVAEDTGQAIDAYGRTSEPIPFLFETRRRGDTVVFLVDTNRGRASVLYDMPPLMAQLAYGPGYRLISLTLALLGLILLGWMLARLLYMGNDRHWLEDGCPQCGKHELMRIGRQSSDRLLNAFGFPAYRYQCRECTWEGIRLSETGETISPKATTVAR